MLNVTLTGVHPQLDGSYPLDGTSFTNRELRTIKLMSGVRSLELADAFAAGDNDVLVAFAAIALRRAGKQFTEEVLWEAPGGSIMFEDDEVEADADPPPPTSSDGEPRSDGSEIEQSERSGTGSNGGGELSPETLSPSLSGTPG